MTAQLQALIDTAWDNRATLDAKNAELRDAVEHVLAELDAGRLRVASREGVGQWTVHQWIKKAVLLSFRLNDNRVMGDNALENAFAAFLEKVSDITSFAKNDIHTGFYVEYASPRGSIASYYPDFIAKASDGTIWIIETKGQEDIDVEPKWQRLLTWCQDATSLDPKAKTYRALFVDQATWDRHAQNLKSFGDATSVFDRS